MRSPFFTTGKKSHALYKHILRYAPTFDAPQLARETVHKKLFPKRKFDSSLSVLMSKLTAHLENFLIHTSIDEHKPYYRQQFLLEELQSHKLTKYFMQQSVKIKEELTAMPDQSSNHFYYKYLLQHELHNFSSRYKKRLLKTDLKELIKAFDVFYIITKLQLCCALLSRKAMAAGDYNVFMVNELLAELEEHHYLQVPAIKLYYSTLKMLQSPEEESYFLELKQHLSAQDLPVSEDEMRSCYTLACNYCVKQVVRGKEHYREELFDLYRAQIDKNLLFSGEYTTPGKIKNIVTTGLRAGEFQWVEQFIKDHKNKVVPDFQDSLYHFNMGALYFYQKKFREALPHLMQVKYLDVFFHLNCKSLLLKTYYELQETEPLFALCDTFRAFLRNNPTLSLNRIAAYRNFIDLSQKLYKTKYLGGKKTTLELEEQINTAKLISDKQWLTEKVKELLSVARR